MKVLALDLSTKTGWSLFEGDQLVDFGVLTISKKISEMETTYPWSYLKAANTIAGMVEGIWKEFKPDIVVIEETNKASFSRYSQKILEFIHKSVLDMFFEWSFSNVAYINSSEWRKVLDIKASKEDKKNNAKVAKANREGKSKKALGLKGKINKKHLALRFVREHFGLNLKVKDNDVSDAICLGFSYIKGARICDGK